MASPSVRAPANEKPGDSREFSVGDRVTVSLSSGRVAEAMVKTVVNHADRVRLQVDYGRDETALVYLWQARQFDSLICERCIRDAVPAMCKCLQCG